MSNVQSFIQKVTTRNEKDVHKCLSMIITPKGFLYTNRRREYLPAGISSANCTALIQAAIENEENSTIYLEYEIVQNGLKQIKSCGKSLL